MRSASFAALAVAVVLAVGCAGAPSGRPAILYVATPEEIGVEMLKLAGVTTDDVVYDLGSGDGRLVITAARRFDARGVGVEIDAKLVQDSRESALKAGVADRVQFLWQDLFQTNLAPATVVTLYLRQDVNLKLRPKLLRELRPGTRIVSHDFDMGDWPPDRTVRVKGPTREHVIYLWIVPATRAARGRGLTSGSSSARPSFRIRRAENLVDRLLELVSSLGEPGVDRRSLARVARGPRVEQIGLAPRLRGGGAALERARLDEPRGV